MTRASRTIAKRERERERERDRERSYIIDVSELSWVCGYGVRWLANVGQVKLKTYHEYPS